MADRLYTTDLGVLMGASAIMVEVECDPPNGTALIRGFSPAQYSAPVMVEGSTPKLVLPFACGIVDVELLTAKRIKLRRLAVQYMVR